MTNLAVRVQNLGKCYRIGATQRQAKTFPEKLRNLLALTSDHVRTMFGKPAAAEILWALRQVSFKAEVGEVVGLIGRNGAGKSTLLKILSQITEPTTGQAEIFGRVGSLLEVGTGFHPDLTGRENVYLNGTLLGMRRAEIDQKFDEIVAFAEVEKFIDTPVKRYSSGMGVRLAFAVAAHLEPEILLVDEVLAVGDVAFQRRCLDKMQDVSQQGRTVFFVSHNMSAVARLCSRAILLENGQIKQDGPVHQVISQYLQSDLGTPAAREWRDLASAPGNDIVRLCGVYVRDDTGRISDTIDIRKSFTIEIEYFNFSNDHYHPYASIQLLNEDDVCLFASGDFTNLEWRHRPRQFTGKVISSCKIPGNLLSEGHVRVLAALTTHNPNRVFAVERNVVSFTVVDHSQGDGARGEYTGHFPGVVRPLLSWHVEVAPDETVTEEKVSLIENGRI